GIRDRNVTGVQTCALPILITDRFAVPVAAPIGAATGTAGPDRQRDRDSPGRQNQSTMPWNRASAYFCRPDSDSTSFASSGLRIRSEERRVGDGWRAVRRGE